MEKLRKLSSVELRDRIASSIETYRVDIVNYSMHLERTISTDDKIVAEMLARAAYNLGRAGDILKELSDA